MLVMNTESVNLSQVWQSREDQGPWACLEGVAGRPVEKLGQVPAAQNNLHLPGAIFQHVLTRLNRPKHLLPDAVLQGLQILARIHKQARLERSWLHGAKEPGKGRLGIRWGWGQGTLAKFTTNRQQDCFLSLRPKLPGCLSQGKPGWG